MAKKVPKAIIVSAYDKDEIERESYNTGIEDILLKPVTQSGLFDSIIKIFGNLSSDKIFKKEESDSVQGMDSIRGARILVVEDNEINQQVAQETLENEGFLVELAGNGKEALHMVMEGEYDIVLMDLQMPVLDGYQATVEIRKNVGYDLPIIALSADAMKGTQERVLEVGMNDFVTKPINFTELFSALVKWLPEKEYTPAVQKKAKKDQQDDFPFEEFLPSFEATRVLSMLSDNQDLYSDILTKFRKNYVGFCGELFELIEKEDWGQVKKKLHTFKGVSGNVGAAEMHKEAVVLEKCSCEEKKKEFLEKLELIKRKIDKANMEIDDLMEYRNTLCDSDSDILEEGELAEELAELGKCIESFDMRAGEILKKIKNNVMRSGYENEYERLSELISNYDFENATIICEELMVKMEGKK